MVFARRFNHFLNCSQLFFVHCCSLLSLRLNKGCTCLCHDELFLPMLLLLVLPLLLLLPRHSSRKQKQWQQSASIQNVCFLFFIHSIETGVELRAEILAINAARHAPELDENILTLNFTS